MFPLVVIKITDENEGANKLISQLRDKIYVQRIVNCWYKVMLMSANLFELKFLITFETVRFMQFLNIESFKFTHFTLTPELRPFIAQQSHKVETDFDHRNTKFSDV